MPGTNQTEYQGETVRVQRPTGRTWQSFLLNMPVLTADQINRIEEYRGSSEERLNVDARIREVVADGKSFLDMAKESFVEIFGQGMEQALSVKEKP